MSYYTKFADVESLLTSTTTGTVMASTDAILVAKSTSGVPFQTTPGQVGGFQTITTATSTATVLPPYGLSLISLGTAGTSGTGWLIQDPPTRGLVKTVWCTTSTSTATAFTVQSTAVTSIMTTAATTTATVVTVQGSGAGGFTLVSLSTSQWVLIGKQGTIGTSAS